MPARAAAARRGRGVGACWPAAVSSTRSLGRRPAAAGAAAGVVLRPVPRRRRRRRAVLAAAVGGAGAAPGACGRAAAAAALRLFAIGQLLLRVELAAQDRQRVVARIGLREQRDDAVRFVEVALVDLILGGAGREREQLAQRVLRAGIVGLLGEDLEIELERVVAGGSRHAVLVHRLARFAVKLIDRELVGDVAAGAAGDAGAVGAVDGAVAVPGRIGAPGVRPKNHQAPSGEDNDDDGDRDQPRGCNSARIARGPRPLKPATADLRRVMTGPFSNYAWIRAPRRRWISPIPWPPGFRESPAPAAKPSADNAKVTQFDVSVARSASRYRAGFSPVWPTILRDPFRVCPAVRPAE